MSSGPIHAISPRMTVIANLMKRMGWVRTSGSELDAAGSQYGTGSNFDFIPEAPTANRFDPTLARQPTATAPPPVLNQVTRPATQAAAPLPQPSPEVAEDEGDWEALMAAARQQAALESSPEVAEEEEEEDWDALMAAAQQRAESDAPSAAKVLATARERAKSEPPFVPEVSPVFAAPPPTEAPRDSASAQVERGAVAANDDRTAVALSTVPAPAPVVPRAAPLAAIAPSAPEDEEWSRLRAAVDVKEHAESERKLRAMREIRRLRGSRGRTGQIASTAPPKRRLAAGTVRPPIDATAKVERAPLIMTPGPVPERPQRPAPAATSRALPRITQRLGKVSGS
jgi:hypothetical protein